MNAPATTSTRDQILAAAVRLYGEHGFRGMTTRRVAEEAHVNEVTIFRLFGSKEKLLDEALRANFQLHAVALPETPGDAEAELTLWATAEYRAMVENRTVIRTTMGEFEERRTATECVAEGPCGAHLRLRAYFEALRERGQLAKGSDIPFATAMLMGTLFSDAMGREMMPTMFPQPESDAPGAYVRLTLTALGFTGLKNHKPTHSSRRAS